MDYLKKAKDKISDLGSQLGEAVKEKTAAAAKILTGNDGMLGNAKKELSGRQQKIDEAVDKAVGMKNGGRVGRRPQRG